MVVSFLGSPWSRAAFLSSRFSSSAFFSGVNCFAGPGFFFFTTFFGALAFAFALGLAFDFGVADFFVFLAGAMRALLALVEAAFLVAVAAAVAVA